MENNDVLSKGIHQSIQKLWIFLIIFIGIDFASNYFYPEVRTSFLAKFLDFLSSALSCLFFSWYFIVNKRWKSFLMALPLLIMYFFFMKDIKSTVDYYIPFETIIDSRTLRNYTALVLTLANVYILSKCYLREENINGKWSLLKVFLLVLGLFSLYNSDLDFIEQLISSATFNSKSTEFFVTFIFYVLTSVRSVAFLGAFLFLMSCIANKENLYTFSSKILQFANRYFVVSVLIAISCIIFSLGYLIESAVSLELDFFGKKLTVFGWLSNISVVAIFVVCTRFVGQFLKERSIMKQKYFGIVGSSVWIPIVNIVSLVMIKFDDKIKFLSVANINKVKKIHLIIASILILFYYKNDILDNDKRLEGILLSFIYIGSIWIVGYIKNYNWVFAAVLAAIVTMIKVFPFYQGLYATEFIFKDYVLDLVKHTFSIAMILLMIVFYGIYYIAFQTLNKK